MAVWSWGVRRRLVYLLVLFLAAAIVAVFLLVVFQSEPSCFDDEKNQGELGIDCGGPCERVCPFETGDIKVVWTKILETGRRKYDAATFILNPNPTHAVKRLGFNLKVFDETNLLITSRSGKLFLNPGEKTVVFHPRLSVGQRVPARAVFEITDPPVWQKVGDVASPLSWRIGVFTNEPFAKLSVSLQNTALVELEGIETVVALSNSSQNVIAVSSSYLERLGSGESKEIVFTWPSPLAETPVFFDFYPHIDLTQLAG